MSLNSHTDAAGTNGHRIARYTERCDGTLFGATLSSSACGALSSALLLLRSANERHPRGLANGSDQVGRNYMRHNQSILMALMREPNDTVFQKTLAVSDYYFSAPDWEYPLGLIQMCAAAHGAQIRGEELPAWLEWLPNRPFAADCAPRYEFLAIQRRPSPTRKPDLLLWGARGTRYHRGQYGSASKTAGQTRAADHCGQGASGAAWRTTCTWAKTFRLAVRRTRPARHGLAPIRTVRCWTWNCKAHELDNLVRHGCQLFPLDRGGQPDPDDHRQCAARGRPDQGAIGIP